jgi:hypothetical protein
MTTMPTDTAAQLETLAAAVARLRPDWRSAAEFYEARSEIIGSLRALTRSPLMTRTVVRFIPVPAPAPLPPSAEETAAASGPPSSRAACLHARPSRRSRHRYPHPDRHVPGQTVLALTADDAT